MKRTSLTIMLFFCFIFMDHSLPAAGFSAGLLDTLQKLTDPNTKEGQILSGATQVMASARDVDYATERTIGESLALEGLQRFGRPVEREPLQQYVNLVGSSVAANSRRSTIPYQFAVLDSPLQNAFAAPGGVIFISRALVGILGNEAELAAVLAHEVGHVSAKHALKSTRRAQFLQGAATITAANMKGNQGKQFQAMIGDLQTVLFDKGLDKEMEFEADAASMETLYRTGYDPSAMIRVLEKLKKVEATSQKKGSWFSTHPPLNERIARLREELKKYPSYASMAKVPERFAKRGK